MTEINSEKPAWQEGDFEVGVKALELWFGELPGRVLSAFRRLKPTVAISLKGTDKSPRILCALCLHPIAYYEDSWAGAMCPTDDVIAHLALMRGDEAMYWRRANQHPPWRPEAGL